MRFQPLAKNEGTCKSCENIKFQDKFFTVRISAINSLK